jgi:hypothetical protein
VTYGLEGRCSIQLSYERMRVTRKFPFQTLRQGIDSHCVEWFISF